MKQNAIFSAEVWLSNHIYDFFSVLEIILCLRLYFEVDICLGFRLSKQIIIPLEGKIGWIKTKKGHFNSFNRSFLNAKFKKNLEAVSRSVSNRAGWFCLK